MISEIVAVSLSEEIALFDYTILYYTITTCGDSSESMLFYPILYCEMTNC